jgi:hypothetical protein
LKSLKFKAYEKEKRKPNLKILKFQEWKREEKT